MFKTKKEYELAMKELLIRIRDGKPVDDLLQSIDYCDAFAECSRSQFITAIDYWVDGNQKTHIEDCSARITRAGLDFIENFA